MADISQTPAARRPILQQVRDGRGGGDLVDGGPRCGARLAARDHFWNELRSVATLMAWRARRAIRAVIVVLLISSSADRAFAGCEAHLTLTKTGPDTLYMKAWGGGNCFVN